MLPSTRKRAESSKRSLDSMYRRCESARSIRWSVWIPSAPVPTRAWRIGVVRVSNGSNVEGAAAELDAPGVDLTRAFALALDFALERAFGFALGVLANEAGRLRFLGGLSIVPLSLRFTIAS